MATADDNITEIGQAYHALYHNIQTRRAYGYGVVSGGQVTPGSDNTVSVDVAGGTALYENDTESIPSETSLSLPAPDPDDPRKDIVVYSGGGTVEVVSGNPAPVPADQAGAIRFDTYDPAPPDGTSGNYVVLAEVWVPAGAATIESGDINDLRTETDISASGLAVSGNELPSSGKAVTAQWTDSDIGRIQAYDFDNSAFRTLQFKGSLIDMSTEPANVRIANNRSLEDGDGNPRVEVNESNTTINDEFSSVGVELNSGNYNRLYSYAGTPAQVFDSDGASIAVQIDTSSTAGRSKFRLPGAGARIESDGLPSFGAGLELQYDSNNDKSTMRSYSHDNGAREEMEIEGAPIQITSYNGLIDASAQDASIKLATGKGFIDGGGTERILFRSAESIYRDEGGFSAIQLRGGAFYRYKADLGSPWQLFDSYGGNVAAEYVASDTPPGTFDFTGAQVILSGTDSFRSFSNVVAFLAAVSSTQSGNLAFDNGNGNAAAIRNEGGELVAENSSGQTTQLT